MASDRGRFTASLDSTFSPSVSVSRFTTLLPFSLESLTS